MIDIKHKFILFILTFPLVIFSIPGAVFGEGDLDYDPPLDMLGSVPIPKDNPSGKNVWPSKMDPKQELGYLLFFDPKLSGDQSTSCSTCHSPTEGWATNESMSRGAPEGTLHWRNSQSVVNTAYLQKLFWGGSSPSLEAQAPSAAKAGRAGNGEDDTMEARLRMTPEYVRKFRKIFGTRWPLIGDAWRAIAAFQRYLAQPNTPFDRYMNGDNSALSSAAIRGMGVFKGKANCFECHNGPLLTDEKYYNLGVPRSGLFEKEGLRQINLRWELYGNKGSRERIYRTFKDDAALFFRSRQWADRGKFRTTPLRYLKYTAPYMHQGQLATLDDVIDFYDRGGDENEFTKGSEGTKTPILRKLKLSVAEKVDIKEFLLSLSGEEIRLPVPKVPKMRRMKNWQPEK